MKRIKTIEQFLCASAHCMLSPLLILSLRVQEALGKTLKICEVIFTFLWDNVMCSSAETFFFETSTKCSLERKRPPQSRIKDWGNSHCYNLNPSLYLFPSHFGFLWLFFFPFKRKSCFQKILHNSNRLSAGHFVNEIHSGSISQHLVSYCAKKVICTKQTYFLWIKAFKDEEILNGSCLSKEKSIVLEKWKISM